MTPDIEERIKARAYAIWMEEGCPEGRDCEHWLQAEQEIMGAESASPQVMEVEAPLTTPAPKPRARKAAAPAAEEAADAPAPKPRTRRKVSA